MALNEKQKKFCELYIKYDNGVKAAEEVGYKGNSTAATLLKKEEIKEYIEFLRLSEPTADPINLKMDTAAEVRSSLTLIANMVINREMDSRTASTLNSLCNTVLNSIRTDEMEKEMNDLKEIIEDLTEEREDR